MKESQLIAELLHLGPWAPEIAFRGAVSSNGEKKLVKHLCFHEPVTEIYSFPQSQSTVVLTEHVTLKQ